MVAGNCPQGKSCMQAVKEAALSRVKLKSSIFLELPGKAIGQLTGRPPAYSTYACALALLCTGFLRRSWACSPWQHLHMHMRRICCEPQCQLLTIFGRCTQQVSQHASPMLWP